MHVMEFSTARKMSKSYITNIDAFHKNKAEQRRKSQRMLTLRSHSKFFKSQNKLYDVEIHS